MRSPSKISHICTPTTSHWPLSVTVREQSDVHTGTVGSRVLTRTQRSIAAFQDRGPDPRPASTRASHPCESPPQSAGDAQSERDWSGSSHAGFISASAATRPKHDQSRRTSGSESSTSVFSFSIASQMPAGAVSPILAATITEAEKQTHPFGRGRSS